MQVGELSQHSAKPKVWFDIHVPSTFNNRIRYRALVERRVLIDKVRTLVSEVENLLVVGILMSTAVCTM